MICQALMGRTVLYLFFVSYGNQINSIKIKAKIVYCSQNKLTNMMHGFNGVMDVCCKTDGRNLKKQILVSEPSVKKTNSVSVPGSKRSSR